MRVERHCVIDADRDTVWKVVSDPDCYPSFMANLARWETITTGPMRVGSRYTVHWTIGSVPVGGVLEVVEFDEARDLAWTSVTGMTLRGRFRLREVHDGRVRITFRLSYQAPGGILGLIADRVATRQVGRTLAATLKSLKALVES
ncbi:MAG: SRPBCC family protein [Mycobacteriaceae bacterium]|nr:SRPBCC family protein [Mycobacteriaceae bacterium]MBV9514549.1 SRPBCC family protein [Mycobacteriaceae bacterium]